MSGRGKCSQVPKESLFGGQKSEIKAFGGKWVEPEVITTPDQTNPLRKTKNACFLSHAEWRCTLACVLYVYVSECMCSSVEDVKVQRGVREGEKTLSERQRSPCDTEAGRGLNQSRLSQGRKAMGYTRTLHHTHFQDSIKSPLYGKVRTIPDR